MNSIQMDIEHSEPELLPEQQLACAVLLQAVIDCKSKDTRVRLRLAAWALSNDYLWWCDQAGLSEVGSERLRKGLLGEGLLHSHRRARALRVES